MPEWLAKPEAMRAVDRYFSGENVANYRGALRRLLSTHDIVELAGERRAVPLRNADAEIAHFKRDWLGEGDAPPTFWRNADRAAIPNKIRAAFIGALTKALDDHAAGQPLRSIRLIWTCAERTEKPGEGGTFEAGLTVDDDSITIVLATSAPPYQPAAGDSGVVAVGDGLELQGTPGTLGLGDPRDRRARSDTVLRIGQVDGRTAAIDHEGKVLWTVDEHGDLDDRQRHGR